MRYPIPLVLVLVLACSSGETGVTPPPAPPPPPPGGLVPAVLAVQAGDGQQAEPGAVVTVKPKVAVKDAAGLGVAGVTVTFSVDSGGGTLQATSAVTAADGTASPGDWHLGSGEGRNVMSATSGSLTKVKFVATAVVSSVTLTTQTVGSGGKTITITAGALAGASLVIPAGAFTQNATWTLEQRSNASWPRRTGVHPVGASLHITSGNTTLANAAMMLTLPASVPAGTKAFVLMRSTATNAIEVLQTVTVDPGTITVAVQHFDASWITPARQGIAGLGSFFRSGAPPTLSYDTEVVVTAIPEAELDGDVDTGFRPGTDDWDIQPMRTSIVTSGPVDSDLQTGIVLTEMAYFAYLKPTTGSLFKKYREIPELPLTNRMGYHAAAYSGFLAPGYRIIDFLTAIRSSMRAGQADQRFYDVLKVNLIVSGLPQFVSAHLLSGSYPLVAYRVVGGRVDLVNPMTPGVGTSVQFTGGQFGPYNLVYNDLGDAQVAEWIGMVPVGQILKMPLQAQDISKIAAGLPASEIDEWPSAKLNARGGFVDDTVLYAVDDTTRFWVECPTCKTGMTSTLPPGRVETFAGYYRTAAGAPANYISTGGSGYLINQTTATDTRIGFVKLEGAAGDVPSWLDFQWIRLKKWVMTLPADLTATIGVPTAFTVAIEGTAAMPAHRFVWTFGAGATATTASSTGPTVTATLAQSGTLPVTVEIRRTGDDKAIAVGKGTVAVAPPKQGWRLTSITKVAEVGPVIADPSNSNDVRQHFTDANNNFYSFESDHYKNQRNTMTQVVANPAVGVIYLWSGATGGAIWIALQVTAPGVPPDLARVPGGSNLGAPMPLGNSCQPLTTQNCATDGASVTGDDTSGSITAQWYLNTKISATKDKDGVTLTGTMRIADGRSGVLGSFPPLHYIDYTFTAVRVP